MRGRPLVAGTAVGDVLRLDEPLSFWGGFDGATGRIVDRRHPQSGQSVAGRILAMTSGKGSSSTSSVLAEAIREGTAPLAIIMAEPDEIVVLGAVVAEELYGVTMPVVLLAAKAWERLRPGQFVALQDDGTILM
ncbi:MAG: DUF126 domain-containing protein [Acidimicrobiales bacterium]